MPLPVACLHHLERPFTGLVGRALHAAGLELDERHLRRGDPLPSLDEVSGVVSFGGEQSVTEIDRYPYLEAQAELMREAVAREVPLFGVCLGGQLLAHSLGGSVRRLPRRYLGWADLAPLPAAAADPVFGAVAGPVPALRWNEDGFEPPPGAVELLERSGPGATAFRAGRCAWAIQFHSDVDEPTLDDWYRDWPENLAEAGVAEDVARAEDARHWPRQHAAAAAVFGAFAALARRASEPARAA